MIQSLVNDSSIFDIQTITFFDATKCRTERLRYVNAQVHTFPSGNTPGLLIDNDYPPEN